jgi:hypothetical protein
MTAWSGVGRCPVTAEQGAEGVVGVVGHSPPICSFTGAAEQPQPAMVVNAAQVSGR